MVSAFILHVCIVLILVTTKEIWQVCMTDLCVWANTREHWTQHWDEM